MSTPNPHMESNPLQRALDNYLVMELQCEAARREAEALRAENAKFLAEVGILREQLASTEADRRKWQVACSTIMGRLLAINDTIAGAVKASVRDGLDANEVERHQTEAAGAVQEPAAKTGAQQPPTEKAPPAPPQLVLAAVPRNEFVR